MSTFVVGPNDSAARGFARQIPCDILWGRTALTCQGQLLAALLFFLVEGAAPEGCAHRESLKEATEQRGHHAAEGRPVWSGIFLFGLCTVATFQMTASCSLAQQT
jgi:hypothetical protein